MWISFPVFPGVRVGGRIGARRGKKPTGCTWFMLSFIALAIAVRYWMVTLVIVGLLIAAVILITFLQSSFARDHRLVAALVVIMAGIGLVTSLAAVGKGRLAPSSSEPTPWVGRDVNGDGKCFNNQYAPVPCPDTGAAPWGRPPSAVQTTTPPEASGDMAAPLTPTENDGPFWSAVQARTGLTGTQARITAINHGRFICEELAKGIDMRILAATGAADAQYTPSQFQTVMATAVEFLCPEQTR